MMNEKIRVIFDKSKIEKIKNQYEYESDRLMSEKMKDYKSVTCWTIILIMIFATAGLISVGAFINIINGNLREPMYMTYVTGACVLFNVIIIAFIIYFYRIGRNDYKKSLRNYTLKRFEFEKPTSLAYASLIEYDEPYFIKINGNSSDRKTDVEVTTKNSADVLKTVTIYGFEVFKSIEDDEIIVDFMNGRVIYPINVVKQEIETVSNFSENGIMKNI